jgi:hypothetical protein
MNGIGAQAANSNVYNYAKYLKLCEGKSPRCYLSKVGVLEA